METGRNCAYNVTRNALLSDRVVAAGDTAGPAEVLSLVLKGPGIDRQACVWVRGGDRLDLPRAIDFDVTYLDDRQGIIAAAGVGLGTDPSPFEGAVSMLILANGRVAETGTIAGDQLRICGEAELAILLKTASQSSMESREQATGVEAVGSTPLPPISFEVSRLSEFVFEPFGGSLMYLPPAAYPLPQSSEYFLTREVTVVPPGAAAVRGNVIWERQTEAEAKEETTQEEPHFYAPKPVRFFDPSLAAETQDESQTGEMEEPAARKSIHLSPELKAAILHIDEELRRNKEELEARGKSKRGRKEKKRKDQKEDATKATKPQETETVSPEPVEASALPEPVVAEAAVVGEVKQDASAGAEPAAVEAEPEMAAGPAEPAVQELPVEVAEEPVLAMEPEPVSVAEPAVAEEVLEMAAGPAEPAVQELPVEVAEAPALATEPEPVLDAEPAVQEEVLEAAAGLAEPEVQDLPVEVAEEPVLAMEPEPVLEAEPAVQEEVLEAAAELAEPEVQEQPVEVAEEPALLEPAVAEEVLETVERVEPEAQELPVEVAKEPALAMEPEPALLEPAVAEEVLEAGAERVEPEVQEQPVEVAHEPEIAEEPEFIAEPRMEVDETHIEAPVSAVAEVEELAPEEVELQLEALAAAEMPRHAEHESEPVAFVPIAAEASPSPEPLPVQQPVRDRVTEIKKIREIKEPEPPPSRKPEPEKEKLSLGTRLQRWISGEASLSGNRRKGERSSSPGMVAYYWSGGAPKPHEIVNISKSGFYLRTTELWSPNTMVRMRLERLHETEKGRKDSISVLARVVRIDEDGVGHEFVTSEVLHAVRSHEILPEMGTNKKELERFLERGSHSHRG